MTALFLSIQLSRGDCNVERTVLLGDSRGDCNVERTVLLGGIAMRSLQDQAPCTLNPATHIQAPYARYCSPYSSSPGV